jgi:hypothetical protein
MRESVMSELCVISESGSDDSNQVDARLPLRVFAIG